jgi:hypothetical protein
VSKLSWICFVFLGLYAAALFYALVASEPSGIVSDYVTQLSRVRLPINFLLLLLLGGAFLLKKPTSTLLLIAAIYNWILVIDDYFVLQIQNFAFESPMAQTLAALRPFVAMAISLIAFESKIAARENAA